MNECDCGAFNCAACSYPTPSWRSGMTTRELLLIVEMSKAITAIEKRLDAIDAAMEAGEGE